MFKKEPKAWGPCPCPTYYFFLQFLSWQKKNLSRDIFAHSIHKCVKLEDPLPDFID